MDNVFGGYNVIILLQIKVGISVLLVCVTVKKGLEANDEYIESLEKRRVYLMISKKYKYIYDDYSCFYVEHN